MAMRETDRVWNENLQQIYKVKKVHLMLSSLCIP